MESSDQILRNIKKLTPRRLGYMAAIIDGEGCVRIQNGRILRISVGNTSTKLLKFLNNKIGGAAYRIHSGKHSGVGKIGGIINGRKIIHRKISYSWRISGDSAHFLLLRILDDLIIKKEAAKWALKFRKTFAHGVRYRRGGLSELVWNRRKLISTKVNRHNKGAKL